MARRVRARGAPTNHSQPRAWSPRGALAKTQRPSAPGSSRAVGGEPGRANTARAIRTARGPDIGHGHPPRDAAGSHRGLWTDPAPRRRIPCNGRCFPWTIAIVQGKRGSLLTLPERQWTGRSGARRPRRLYPPALDTAGLARPLPWVPVHRALRGRDARRASARRAAVPLADSRAGAPRGRCGRAPAPAASGARRAPVDRAGADRAARW
jgi:hypothetical protein